MTKQKNKYDEQELELKIVKAQRNADILISLINAVKTIFIYAIISCCIILGIKIIIPHPVENIHSFFYGLSSLLNVIISKIGLHIWLAYLIIIFLFILVILMKNRNKALTKTIGELRKQIENNDIYRSSSHLNEYGENK